MHDMRTYVGSRHSLISIQSTRITECTYAKIWVLVYMGASKCVYKLFSVYVIHLSVHFQLSACKHVYMHTSVQNMSTCPHTLMEIYMIIGTFGRNTYVRSRP
jgi:hypothetical protein